LVGTATKINAYTDLDVALVDIAEIDHLTEILSQNALEDSNNYVSGPGSISKVSSPCTRTQSLDISLNLNLVKARTLRTQRSTAHSPVRSSVHSNEAEIRRGTFDSDTTTAMDIEAKAAVMGTERRKTSGSPPLPEQKIKVV